MDVVYRQDVIDHFRKRLIETANNNVGYKCDAGSVFEDAAERVRVWANEVPAALPAPQWIPCAERLPEKYIGEWLCCTDDGQILILPYDTPGDGSKECVFYEWDDKWDMYDTYNVVAWMPLPKPYEGGE